jgi:hypothetical protein
MALQDSNAERRNLTVLSVSIILYFLAGGALTSDIVRLQVINVEFQNPEVLKYFVWILLLWFGFRYWLLNKGSWKEPLVNELCSRETCSAIYYPHLIKLFGLSEDYSLSYYKDRHWVKLEKSSVNLVEFKHIFRSESGQQLSKKLEAETISDKIIIFRCIVELFFRQPTISGYFVPYFIFLWALFLIVKSAL